MTQPDAFSKMEVGFKRTYEAWKAIRKLMDPDFDASRYKDVS